MYLKDKEKNKSKPYQENVNPSLHTAIDKCKPAGSMKSRLEHLMGEEKPFVWAKKVGINSGTFSNIWAEANVPKVDILNKIASYADVSLDWLINGEGPMRPGEERQDEPFVAVDRVNATLSAGHGAWNPDHIEVIEKVPFTREFLQRMGRRDTKDLVILKAEGDSMLPTIADNDLVMIDTRQKTLVADAIYAFVADGTARIKRLRTLFGKGIEIISDNRDLYPAQTLEGEDANRLNLIGKVIWVGRYYG